MITLIATLMTVVAYSDERESKSTMMAGEAYRNKLLESAWTMDTIVPPKDSADPSKYFFA